MCKTNWMKRHCRRTCGACQSSIGDCPNRHSDDSCDLYARNGMCQLKKDEYEDSRIFIKGHCQDSCNSCNWRKPDLSCRNKDTDENCERKMKLGQCEKNPLKMFDQCPSTCQRCYWNRGSCQNKLSIQECNGMALKNWCTHSDIDRPSENMHPKAVRMCAKTCDTCSDTRGTIV